MKEEMKKYELTSETITVDGHTLHRIRALRTFVCQGGSVKEGHLGGFIEKEENLSHDGGCWISPSAKVYGDAKVYGYARVFGQASVFDSALVFGYAWVNDDAMVYGCAKICDSAMVYGRAKVYGHAEVLGRAKVSGDAEVFDDAIVYECAKIHGNYRIFGDDKVGGRIECPSPPGLMLAPWQEKCPSIWRNTWGLRYSDIWGKD